MTIELNSELFSALAKAQAEYPAIPKTKEVKFQSNRGLIQYKYADLADINKAIAPINAKHGLAITQIVDVEENNVLVQTIILHSSGQQLETGVLSAPYSGDVKSMGALITYLRRYSLSSALNIVTDDDVDGDTPLVATPVIESKPKLTLDQMFDACSDEVAAERLFNDLQTKVTHIADEQMRKKKEIELNNAYITYKMKGNE